MTDKNIADRIYIEPLTLITVKRIIEKERPDSILSGLGGQTGLTLCMQLARDGFLDKLNVRLLGSSPETIDKAEDRKLFKETMQNIGQPVIPSVIATDVETAVCFANETGYPIIIRPAFTLGGSGGGIEESEKKLREIAAGGLTLSPIHQILVEKSVAGWKEIEFEVMRDRAGNAITVCSMENFEPVGVHTGDSIVIAPAVTLSDREYQMLRSAALDIIRELGVEGGCNCQFALHPHSFEYAVIEVNPRVSRSSALASKATGYVKRTIGVSGRCGDECPHHNNCRYMRHMKRAQSGAEYDFQVCNHNYLLADTLRRAKGQSPFIPHYQAIIIDEAHKFLSAARDMYGAELDAEAFSRLKNDICSFTFKRNESPAPARRLAIKLESEGGRLFRLLNERIPEKDCEDETERYTTVLDEQTLRHFHNIQNIINNLYELLSSKPVLQ